MVMVKKRKQESKKKMWVTNTQLKNKANTNNIKKNNTIDQMIKLPSGQS